MAQPQLIPITLPDGRVVNMLPDSGGMLSQEASGATNFADVNDPNMAEWNAMGGGGAGAPLTPAQQAIVDDDRARSTSPFIEHQPAVAPQAGSPPDPFKGASFSDVTSTLDANIERPQGTQQIPDPQPQAAPAGGRARLIKGGPQKTNWQVQPGAEISAERMAGVQSSYDESISGMRQSREDIARAQQDARIDADVQRLKEQDVVDAQRERRVAIDADIQGLAKQRDAAQQEAEAAAVNPTRLIEDQPWVAMLAGIGIALQGAAQREVEILTGSSPQPIATRDVLNRAIQDDIRNQQIKYEQAQDKAALADNRYGKALQLYGTPEDAAKALEAQDLQLAQSWLQSKRSQITDQQQAASFDAVIDDLEREKQQTLLQLEDASAAKVTENWANIPDRVVGGSGAAGGKAAPRQVRLPDGRTVFASSPEEAKKANDAIRAAADVEAKANAIINLRKQSGFGERLMGTGKGAELAALETDLKIAVSKSAELGAWDAGSAELISGLVPNASDAVERGWEEKLGQIKKVSREKASRHINQSLYDDPNATQATRTGVPGER